MFKNYLMGFILVWTALVFLSVWAFHAPSLESQREYKCLMNSRDELQKEMQTEKRPIRQTRYQVSKQILYKRDSHRMQSQMMGEESNLIFKSKEGGAELVECFKGITCLMQEKLIEDQEHKQRKQYIRFLKAHEAFYYYTSGQLQAQDVEMAHYLIPEHVLPVSLDAFTPFLQGHAENFQLSLCKEPIGRAEKFQAIFRGWGAEW